jgi:anti-sigma B factor antagonist
MNGPLGGVPSAEQLMTIERDDRGGCLVLVVHGEVDLSTGGRLMEAGSAALQESAHQPVVLDLTGVDLLS